MAGVALGDVDALMANDDLSPAALFSLEGLGLTTRRGREVRRRRL